MIRRALHTRARRFARDESGATLVEFGVSFVAFLLIFFALIDFGRMAFAYVVAEKGVQMAARIAAVRPPACAGVPLTNLPATGTTQPFGTKCNVGGVCATSTVSCSGNSANATVNEIWNTLRFRDRFPSGTTEANLQFIYAYDQNMGFLGGPYVPNVTVELRNACFTFHTPLAGFVRLLGGTPGANLGTTTTSNGCTSGTSIDFPTFSVSLPGEDLDAGTAG